MAIKNPVLRWVVLIVVITLFTILLGRVVNWGIDSIPDGTAPAPSSESERLPVVEADIQPVACCMTHTDNGYLGMRMAERFESGSMRDSGGDILLPFKVRAMLWDKVNTRKERRRDWWRSTLNFTACVSNMGGSPLASKCITSKAWDDKRHYRFWKQVTKVKLTCGGSAVFGYVSGQWKGAVIGASSCAWTKAVELW
jgi:hypothetical protein